MIILGYWLVSAGLIIVIDLNNVHYALKINISGYVFIKREFQLGILNSKLFKPTSLNQLLTFKNPIRSVASRIIQNPTPCKTSVEKLTEYGFISIDWFLENWI